MKKYYLLFILIATMQGINAQFTISQYPVYTGPNLGLTYSKAGAGFKIWSPPAEAAELLFYKEGTGGQAYKNTSLKKLANGIWSVILKGDWKGTFYTFRVKIKGSWSNEVADPYAKAVGVNGLRAMVVNLKETNPAGWSKDKSPSFSATNKPTDAILYELHIRDASIAANSGIQHK